ILQPQIFHRRIARNQVEKPRKGLNTGKTDNILVYVPAQERNAEGGEDQERDPDLDRIPEALSTKHAANRGTRPSTYHPVNIDSLFLQRFVFRRFGRGTKLF